MYTDSLVGLPNRAAVLGALERLPSEIHGAYDIVMGRIKEQGESDEILAKRVLLWVSQSRQPLSVTELQHALAVMPGMKQMDADYVIDEDVLISVCGGLVVVGNHSIVRFVRKWTAIKCRAVWADPQQTIQHRNTLDTGESFCFRTLRKLLLERASHTSHSTPFEIIPANPIQNYRLSQKITRSCTTPLGTGAIMRARQKKSAST
jgi:hypothetical protein